MKDLDETHVGDSTHRVESEKVGLYLRKLPVPVLGPPEVSKFLSERRPFSTPERKMGHVIFDRKPEVTRGKPEVTLDRPEIVSTGT